MYHSHLSVEYKVFPVPFSFFRQASCLKIHSLGDLYLYLIMYHLNWITQPIVIQDRSMLSYMGWIVASLHHSEAGQRLDINAWSCYWQQSHGIFLNTALEYWRMWKTSKLNKVIERTYNHEGYWKLLKIVAITQSIWLFGANSWRCTLSIMYTIGVVFNINFTCGLTS